MVYLYSEDSKGGFHLINLLNEIYFDKKFVVVSLDGIYKLGEKIDRIINKMDKDDQAIIIYDDSPGNMEVKNELDIAYERINELKINNIYFIAIVCMEYEILSAYGIKIFAHKKIHSIIDDLFQYRNKTTILKNHLKTDIQYKIYKDKAEAKIQKRYASRCKKTNINIPLTRQELNKKITMDSICKEIMADGFQNELIIDKPNCLGRCWLDECCIKRNKICNIKDNEIIKNQIKGIDKQKFLMYFSRYHKVAAKISEITGVDIPKIKDSDMEKIINFTGIGFELNQYDIKDIITQIKTV